MRYMADHGWSFFVLAGTTHERSEGGAMHLFSFSRGGLFWPNCSWRPQRGDRCPHLAVGAQSWRPLMLSLFCLEGNGQIMHTVYRILTGPTGAYGIYVFLLGSAWKYSMLVMQNCEITHDATPSGSSPFPDPTLVFARCIHRSCKPFWSWSKCFNLSCEQLWRPWCTTWIDVGIVNKS